VVKNFAFWSWLSGYFLTVLYYYGPRGIALSESLFHILPFWMCILTGKGMPVLPVVFFIAPINAAIYGGTGAVTGWLIGKFVEEIPFNKDASGNLMQGGREPN